MCYSIVFEVCFIYSFFFYYSIQAFGFRSAFQSSALHDHNHRSLFIVLIENAVSVNIFQSSATAFSVAYSISEEFGFTFQLTLYSWTQRKFMTTSHMIRCALLDIVDAGCLDISIKYYHRWKRHANGFRERSDIDCSFVYNNIEILTLMLGIISSLWSSLGSWDGI